MSFWGKLGKGLLTAAPFVAAPFTGGASLLAAGPSMLSKAAGLAGKLAPVLGGLSKGRNESRQANDTNSMARDRIALDSYNSGLKSPSTRLNTSLAASRVANRQPVTAEWGGPGAGLRGQTVKFNGGSANPNLISPDTKALAEDTMHQEMLQGMGGKGGPPTLSQPQDSSTLDNIIGGASTASSILGALTAGDEEDPKKKKTGVSTPPFVSPDNYMDAWG